MSNSDLPANVGSNDGLGVGDGARWYCVSRDGLAMLCLNEHNAHAMAAQNSTEFPNHAPYKAIALGDVAAERERCVQACRDEVERMWGESFARGLVFGEGMPDAIKAVDCCVKAILTPNV